ncbi:Imm1 family immunity protein [Amycolatopsis sp. NBC_00438]|uniref:Imm1 family immunity protein n=1 Tax=Amycolatopsis sp. NBC_00438 TaxID=2903558 RepID=UPI002E1DFCC2
MVTLEVWYNQEPENDYAGGEPAIVVRTADELDSLIAQVQDDTKDVPVPSMVECSVSGDPSRGTFYLGIGQHKGFVMFLAPETAHTEGDTSLTNTVLYDFMAHTQEIPARYEVGMAEARSSAWEFMTTGSLPTGRSGG